MEEKNNFNPDFPFWRCKQCKFRNGHSRTKCEYCHVQKDTRFGDYTAPPNIRQRRRQQKLANNERKDNNDDDNEMKMKNKSIRSGGQQNAFAMFGILANAMFSMDKNKLSPENRVGVEDVYHSLLPLSVVEGRIDQLRKQLQESLTHKVEYTN